MRLVPVLLAAGLVLAGCDGSDPDGGGSAAAPSAPVASGSVTDERVAPRTVEVPALRRLERAHDVRLGVYAVDTGSLVEVRHRAGARFPYASAFKALLAGAVLDRTDGVQLGRRLPVTAADLAHNSPLGERRVGGSMSVREALEAAVRHSDNTAANLLLKSIGGPRGLRSALRRIGDRVTSPARYEPALNEHAPGDRRDTSTPAALAESLAAYALPGVLAPSDRALLVGWLQGSTTGPGTIRAGAPGGWVVGNKTGTAAGVRNDVAVLWPPRGQPVVLAVLTLRDADEPVADAVLARVTRVVLAALQR